MTLIEFINKYNGQGNVGTTSENAGECVGIVQKWLKNTASTAPGLKYSPPYIWGHAKDLLINADPNFYEVIKNTPIAVPGAGDVIVWVKEFNSTYGHTAIVTKATVNTFEVFEQNNPLGSPCRLHTYKNYAYVDGWLRKRGITAQPTAQPEDGLNALKPLKALKDQFEKVKPGGNLEGWINTLTQDAWPVYLKYKAGELITITVSGTTHANKRITKVGNASTRTTRLTTGTISSIY